MCVFDCEGVNLSATGELTLLQIAYESYLTNNIECVIFDILSLKKITKDGGEVNKGLLKSSLQTLFGNSEFKKYAHDFRMDIAALSHQLGITANNIFDTQIMYELCTGNMFGSLNRFLKLCEIEEHKNKKSVHSLMDSDPELWKRRPLQENLLSYARADVVCLYRAVQQIWTVAVPNTLRNNEIEKHLLDGKDIEQVVKLLAASSTNRKLTVYKSPKNAKEREFAFLS